MAGNGHNHISILILLSYHCIALHADNSEMKVIMSACGTSHSSVSHDGNRTISIERNNLRLVINLDDIDCVPNGRQQPDGIGDRDGLYNILLFGHDPL